MREVDCNISAEACWDFQKKTRGDEDQVKKVPFVHTFR